MCVNQSNSIARVGTLLVGANRLVIDMNRQSTVTGKNLRKRIMCMTLGQTDLIGMVACFSDGTCPATTCTVGSSIVVFVTSPERLLEVESINERRTGILKLYQQKRAKGLN